MVDCAHFIAETFVQVHSFGGNARASQVGASVWFVSVAFRVCLDLVAVRWRYHRLLTVPRSPAAPHPLSHWKRVWHFHFTRMCQFNCTRMILTLTLLIPSCCEKESCWTLSVCSPTSHHLTRPHFSNKVDPQGCAGNAGLRWRVIAYWWAGWGKCRRSTDTWHTKHVTVLQRPLLAISGVQWRAISSTPVLKGSCFECCVEPSPPTEGKTSFSWTSLWRCCLFHIASGAFLPLGPVPIPLQWKQWLEDIFWRLQHRPQDVSRGWDMGPWTVCLCHMTVKGDEVSSFALCQPRGVPRLHKLGTAARVQKSRSQARIPRSCRKPYCRPMELCCGNGGVFSTWRHHPSVSWLVFVVASRSYTSIRLNLILKSSRSTYQRARRVGWSFEFMVSEARSRPITWRGASRGSQSIGRWRRPDGPLVHGWWWHSLVCALGIWISAQNTQALLFRQHVVSSCAKFGEGCGALERLSAGTRRKKKPHRLWPSCGKDILFMVPYVTRGPCWSLQRYLQDTVSITKGRITK